MEIITPITEDVANTLQVGDMVYISGSIYCGRDAVLPKIVKVNAKHFVTRALEKMGVKKRRS